jgi:hypothetical protein
MYDAARDRHSRAGTTGREREAADDEQEGDESRSHVSMYTSPARLLVWASGSA